MLYLSFFKNHWITVKCKYTANSVNLLPVVPAHGTLVNSVRLNPILTSESSFVIFLAVVLVHFLRVIPTHRTLVLSVILNTKLTPKPCLVILLRVVLGNLL